MVYKIYVSYVYYLCLYRLYLDILDVSLRLAAVLSYFSTAGGGMPGSEDFVRLLVDEALLPWRQKEAVPWAAWKMLGI